MAKQRINFVYEHSCAHAQVWVQAVKVKGGGCVYVCEGAWGVRVLCRDV